MDIEKHIESIKSEIEHVVVTEVKSRYRAGIAYLCFSESKELRILWRSRESLGIESISIAFERAMYSPRIAEYIDGLAIGNLSSNMIDRGVFWNFKQGYQIFNDSYEFGPADCKYPMLTTSDQNKLSILLRDDSDMGRFVFTAMKYIAVYKSLSKKCLYLADEQFFRHFGDTREFLSDAVEILNELLVGRNIASRVISSRGSWMRKKPMFKANLDIEITWS